MKEGRKNVSFFIRYKFAHRKKTYRDTRGIMRLNCKDTNDETDLPAHRIARVTEDGDDNDLARERSQSCHILRRKYRHHARADSDDYSFLPFDLKMTGRIYAIVVHSARDI